MAKAILVIVCVGLAATCGVWGQGETPLEFGMDMASKAYDAACWYENLKNFPNTNTKQYLNCGGALEFQKKQVLTTNQDYFAFYPDKKVTAFGEWNMANMGSDKIPSQYNTNCVAPLKDPKATPTSDESDALNDGGNDYPYKAFAYCMLNTLRQTHGDKAIEAVKNERTKQLQDWMKTLNDRDNEFRARHGSPPLGVVEELNKAAQEWAETNARECQSYHSDRDSDGRQFQGSSTGESIMAGYEDDKAIAAYEASDGWYEEVKNYPFPGGFDGQDQAIFMKTGHFTQTVWKDSKYVGYGYASNPSCKDQGGYTTYIVGRYFPPGNYPDLDHYTKNVLPPKN